MIGKFVSFNSCVNPQLHARSAIFGEIVGLFQTEPRQVNFVHGSPLTTYRTILIIRLATFAKNKLIEMPAEFVTVFDNLHDAEDSTKIG